MSIFSLKNQHVSISIDSRGAELTSIKSVKDGMEYLWQPVGTIYWQRQSPLLFPIIGKLKDGQYIVNGVKYPMNQHGCVRDVEFDVIGKSNNQLIYWLKDGTDSQKQYPFGFELRVIYTLIENKVSVRFMVKNTNNELMWFSIGGHPAFKCPLREGDLFQDYYLTFENKETVERHFLEAGLISERKEVLLNNTDKLPLQVDLFREDALVLKSLTSRKVTLKSDKHDRSVTVHFPSFPFLGIWTQPNAPFLCIEPWHGCADNNTNIGDIKDKDGIISLQPGKIWEGEYLIEIQ